MFAELGYRNILATYANRPKDWRILSRLFDLYSQTSDRWSLQKHLGPGLMILRSAGAFAGAACLGASGQAPECFMAVRGILESALYAIGFWKKPTTAEIWLRRHDDEGTGDRSKNLVRSTFKIATLRKMLKKEDERLERILGIIYEICLDYGAHPNERTVTRHMQFVEGQSGQTLKVKYLNPDPERLAFSMKTTAEAGVISLRMFGLIDKDAAPTREVEDLVAEFH